MARLANNNDFNKDTRNILMKIEIYLDGDNQPPLVVDKENYLIRATLLEETGSDSDWPLGSVSANELTFQLYSHRGLFCPTNPESPYYGKIKSRIKVRPYFKPADPEVEEWIPMGVFYVTDWKASITGIVANVVAHDILRDIFKEKPIELPIKRNTTYKAFYQEIFDALGIAVVISDYFDKPLPWSFVIGSNSHVLRSLASSDMTICSCNREGIVQVRHISESTGLKDTLTDMNQIKSADTEQSITKAYDGVSLTYKVPQLSEETELANVQSIITPPGTYEHNKISFGERLMQFVTSITMEREGAMVVGYKATSNSITITTHNPKAEDIESNLFVRGIFLDRIARSIEDEGEKLLSISNDYIQSATHANTYVDLLKGFINSNMPDISLEIRGNPLLQLGDRVDIVSDKFKLNYPGRIRQTHFKYDGSLEASIKVINNNLFGGV